MASAPLRTLRSGGVLHLDEHGERQGTSARPPLLLLHGVGGAAFSFEPQRLGLAGEARCFVFEARGHGAAARVEDAGLGDYFVDAGEALSEVSAITGRKVVLVGHSMGALIALALACQRPGEVAGLFLVDPVYAEAGEPPRRLPGVVVALARILVAVVARSYRRDGWLSRFLSRRFYRWAFQDRAAMEQAWQAQRSQVPLEYPRMLFEALEGVRGFPFQPFADRVDARTFLVEAVPREGARSRFTEVVARLAARLGERAGYARVVGGHYLQLDRPGEVTRLLRDFLARVNE